MIIIRLQGGMGNQLFQYALYESLRAAGREVLLDDENGYADDRQRKPVLKEAFGIDYPVCTHEQYLDITDSRMDAASRLRRKLTGRKTKEYCEKGTYDPGVFELDDAYLNGYWQSEKYFPDEAVRKRLRELFAPDLKKFAAGLKGGEHILEAAERAGDSSSVSVHIRRGDYLLPGTRETHGGICSAAYYERAMGMIREKVPAARFFVFSDDPDWVRENFSGPDIEAVDIRAGAGREGGFGDARADAAELLLMAACRHHILANSSFSWWGAWLSAHRGAGLVTAPDRWYNDRDAEDTYTQEMIRIGSEQ